MEKIEYLDWDRKEWVCFRVIDDRFEIAPREALADKREVAELTYKSADLRHADWTATREQGQFRLTYRRDPATTRLDAEIHYIRGGATAAPHVIPKFKARWDEARTAFSVRPSP